MIFLRDKFSQILNIVLVPLGYNKHHSGVSHFLLFQAVEHWKEAEKALYCWYDIYGEKYFSLYAYKKGNTLEEELLNYHFNRAYRTFILD